MALLIIIRLVTSNLLKIVKVRVFCLKYLVVSKNTVDSKVMFELILGLSVVNSGLLGVCVCLYGCVVLWRSVRALIQMYTVCKTTSHRIMCCTDLEVCTGAQRNRRSWTGPQMLYMCVCVI